MKVSRSATMTYPVERVNRVWACGSIQQELYDFGCRAGGRCCEDEPSPFPRSGPADGLFPYWQAHSRRGARSRVVLQLAMKLPWRSSDNRTTCLEMAQHKQHCPAVQGVCRSDAVPSRKRPSTGEAGVLVELSDRTGFGRWDVALLRHPQALVPRATCV